MTAVDRDPFALARTEGDDLILSLFRQWCEELRNENARPADEDLEMDVVDDLAEEIFEATASGPAGLAIKAYMLAYEVCLTDDLTADSRVGPDVCAIPRFDPDNGNYSRRHRSDDSVSEDAMLFLMQRALRGLLDSAARFVPELRPLVAGLVSSPLSLPPAP